MENKGASVAGVVACGAIWALLTFIGAAVGATVTTFDSKGAFAAATGGALLTIEGFEAGTAGPLLLPETFPSGLSVDLASGEFHAGVFDPICCGYTNTTPGGQRVLTFEGTGDYIVAFSVPLSNAFGFDLSGFQPASFASGGFQASFLRYGAQVGNIFVVDETDFTVDFRGFTSDTSFDEVRIQITSGYPAEEDGDFVAFDEVVFAATQATQLTASFTATCPFGICIFGVGQAISFTDSSQGNPTTWSYDWDGDGVFEDAGRVTPRTSHTYFSPGTYSPRLRVARDGETSEYTHGSITIQGSLQARFTATCPPGPDCDFFAGNAVAFTDQSQGGPTSWSYDWDGNGSFEDANLAAPRTSHTYLAPGVVSPRLRVARDGQTAEFAHSPITIQPLPPLEVDIGPEQGFAPPEVEPEAPRATIGPDGRKAVVWQQVGAGGTVIRGQLFDPDGRPTTPAFSVSQTAGNNVTPTAAFDDLGNLLVFWTRDEGSAAQDGGRLGFATAANVSNLVRQQLDKNGKPISNEGVVSSGGTGESAVPESESDLSGNSVVVWKDGGKIRARILDANGNPRGAPFDVNTGNLGSNPALAVSGSGEFAVVWQGVSANAPAIFVRRFREDGVPKGDPTLVATAGAPSHPAIAIDDAGQFVVAWDANGQSGRDIFTRRYAANGSARAEARQANAAAAGDQTRPRIDINAKGRFAVVWESTEGPPAGAASIQGQSLLGRMFNTQGEPEGVEVEIAAAENGTTPERPDVILDEKDDVAVVYERRGAGGRSAGIFRTELDVTAPPSACVADATTLCSSDGRFRVTALWEEPESRTVTLGQAVPLTGDTGFFWFFGADNVEVVVKTLGACPVNGRFWVFAAGLTNLEITLRVDDVVTGQSRTYFNERSEAFQPILDSDAFATCDAASLPAIAPSAAEVAELREQVLAGLLSLAGDGDPDRPFGVPQPISETASALCATDGDSLCLSASRFQVEVQFLTKSGQGGAGQATKLTGDTGYFWFFDPSNVEIVVKVLNACSISNRIWVFAAGLTDVEAVITIVDTNTGARREYANPQGTAFLPIQDTNAFATCP